MKTYLAVLKKYAVFSGRDARVEFWTFVLINWVIAVLPGILGGFLHGDDSSLALIPGYLFPLAIFLPFLAVQIRRLHDMGRSGWWWFIVLVPLIGALVLFVFFLMDSEPGENKYGPNPKEDGGLALR